MVTGRWALKEPTSTEMNPAFVTQQQAPDGIHLERLDRVRALDEVEVAVPVMRLEVWADAARDKSGFLNYERDIRSYLPAPPEPPTYESVVENNHVLRDMLEQEHGECHLTRCRICREIAAKGA